MHAVVGTVANAHAVTQISALLHGQETELFGDFSYRGMHKRAEVTPDQSEVHWHVAMMPSHRIPSNQDKPMGAIPDALKKTKTRIRAKVEHAFRPIKCQFGCRKTRFRGLAKNNHQLRVMFALSNLWLVQVNFLGRRGMSVPATRKKSTNTGPIRPEHCKIAAIFDAGCTM